MRSLNVNVPGRSYSVRVDRGLLERLGELVQAVVPHERAMLAVDAAIAETHGDVAASALRAAGADLAVFPIEAAETHKTLQTVQKMYDVMLAAPLERGSPVIALGGGVVGDVAGYAAATYMRGVPLVQVPTTLLAMVDASIGGKTGVNHPRPDGLLGKNLIGAFWQPAAVFADPDVLRTLDARDLRCGLAECVKHGVLGDAELLAMLGEQIESISHADPDVMEDLIERSARIKIAIVEADEREQGQRALLNLGHTFAHAVEPMRELDLRHGEAVAIGLVAAARCAHAAGRLEASDADAIETLLAALGLPTRLPRPIDLEQVMRAMHSDKKVTGGRIRLVLPTALGAAVIADDVPPSLVEAAWRQVGAAPDSGGPLGA